MTIDEAIRHCREVAEEQEELYRICPASESETSYCNGTKDCKVLKNGKNKGCQKCAAEYRQTAGWLKELKQLRNQTKTGHWIDNFNGTISCSCCHIWFHNDGRFSYIHYCPNCGARMDEDERTLKYADQDTLKYADQDTMMPAT